MYSLLLLLYNFNFFWIWKSIKIIVTPTKHNNRTKSLFHFSYVSASLSLYLSLTSFPFIITIISHFYFLLTFVYCLGAEGTLKNGRRSFISCDGFIRKINNKASLSFCISSLSFLFVYLSLVQFPFKIFSSSFFFHLFNSN